MAFEQAKAFLEQRGRGDRVITFEISTATVELAAAALGTECARIAKSLTFLVEGQPVMIVCAGDRKIDNAKYKAYFHKKATMMTPEQVKTLVGHEVGGVCPFGINEGVQVYLDVSLKEFDTVYPACGNAASAVRLNPAELEALVSPQAWVDVCKCVNQ